MNTFVIGDEPVVRASEDRFQVRVFAQAVGRVAITAPCNEGLVICLNGPWGSGKTSILNLIEEQSAAGHQDKVKIVRFNPWWYSNADSIAQGFIQELIVSVCPQSLREKAVKVGASVLRPGIAIGTGAFGMGAAGAALNEQLNKLLPDESVNKLHGRLVDGLRQSPVRYVVMIDDIDRLDSDEAKMLFKMVKSLGRLPNVVYILAMDVELISGLIGEKAAGQGRAYLEKIIQASFDVPRPIREDMIRALVKGTASLWEGLPIEKKYRLHRVLKDDVLPFLKAPRHLARFVSALQSTWHAVKDEVNPVDFILIECIRMFSGDLYQAIRDNGDVLCQTGMIISMPQHRRDVLRDKLLGNIKSRVNDDTAAIVRDLFPAMDFAHHEIEYSAEYEDEWSRDRRICSSRHFETYFRYDLSRTAVPKAFLDSIFEPGLTDDDLRSMFLAFIKQGQDGDSARALALVGEIESRSAGTGPEKTKAIMKAVMRMDTSLFSEEAAMSSGCTRLQWMLNALVRDRFGIKDRSEIIQRMAEVSTLDFLVDLADRCIRPYADQNERGGHESIREPLVDEETAKSVVDAAMKSIISDVGAVLDLPTIDAREALLFWLHRGSNYPRPPEVLTGHLNTTSRLVKFIDIVTNDIYRSSEGHEGSRTERELDFVFASRVLDPTEFLKLLQDVAITSDMPSRVREAIIRFRDSNR